VALLILTVAGALACAPAEQPTDEVEALPPIEVELPPVPVLNTDRPMSHADGSHSVWGLSQNRDELLGEVVSVTGFLSRVYICEQRPQQEVWDRAIMFGEAAPEGTGAPEERCNYPHLFIADDLTAERTLLVTGYSASAEPLFQVGQQYTFEGRFEDETRGFNQAGNGLIYATSITGGYFDLPPEEREALLAAAQEAAQATP